MEIGAAGVDEVLGIVGVAVVTAGGVVEGAFILAVGGEEEVAL